MFRLLLLVLLLFPLGSVAQAVYRTTDAQGNTVFTDTPPANATPANRVEIRPTNTTRPLQVTTPPAPMPTSEGEAKAVSYTVSITAPANETSIPMGPGNFSVTAKVSPTPVDTLRLQLFIDGAPRGEPQQASTWDLTNVFRGSHDLTVGVIDGSGETVAISESVRVFVHRPSTNRSNRQTPPMAPRPPRPAPN